MASHAPSSAADPGLPFAGNQPVWHLARPRTSQDALRAIGAQLRRAWSGEGSGRVELLQLADVLAAAAQVSAPSVDEAIALVGSHLGAQYDLAEQSWDRMVTEIAKFGNYLDALGVVALDSVDELVALEFIEQAIQYRGGAWAEPGASTQHVRRNAIRLLYRGARGLGLAGSDPTIDIRLPPRGRADRRPLTDDEEALGRIWATRDLNDLRHAAAWALGQATATNTELAYAVVGDVDLGAGRVWLHGNDKKRDPRWGTLTEWGTEMVAKLLESLPDDLATPLLSQARSLNSRQVSTNILVNDVMVWAGLRIERDLAPSSLPAWAGRAVLDQTGRIDYAAKALGIRSLDRTAVHIGWEW